MSTGANLEETSLKYLDAITAAGNGSTQRQNAVLASSAERLVNELGTVYNKIGTKGTGASEAQQLNARLNNLSDLLSPAERKGLTERMQSDLRAAEKTGNNSAKELAKILGATSDTIKQNARPNLPAIENAGKRLETFWAKENSLFRDRVTAMTQAAAAEGKSWRKLAGEVRELLLLERKAGTESARSQAVNTRLGISARAELIARTELQTAYVQGQIGQYRENGYEWVRWIAAAERSCPYCISRDGLVYELGEIEAAIPAHPRCRCSLAPTDPPANWKRKGTDRGVEAAESLDDAYWARSRANKLREFRESNPRFTDADIRRYVKTPTNAQQYLRPGTAAPEPVWAPSGSLSPNLEQVVLNAAAAAKAVTDRRQAAALEREQAKLKKEAEQQAVAEDTAITPGKGDTVNRYSSQRAKGGEPDGSTRWTPERQKLHDEIVAKFLATGKAVANPKFTMSGGGPASGKGYMLEQVGITKNGKPKKGQVVIDSDEIKKLLPDYKALVAKGGKSAQLAASYVHEESSYLAKRIMEEAAKRSFNVVLDGTGDNGINSLAKKVKKFREMGYKVEAIYVSADTNMAALRNWERYIKTSRLPPEWMLRNVHSDVSRTLPQAMNDKLFDKVTLYDTNLSGQMRLVASANKKGTTVHDAKLWDDFLAKGNTAVLTKADEPRLIGSQIKAAKEQGRAIEPLKPVKSLKKGVDTVALHSEQRAGGDVGPGTRWSLERQALHQKIVDDFLSTGVKVKNPTFTMSGGGPASGKGYLLSEMGYVDSAGKPQKGTVVIDSDEIKKRLPEYQNMLKQGGKASQKAAGFVHEESSYLAKRIMEEASKRSFNVVLDGTGDNGIKSLAKKVDAMRAKGYKVEAKYVSADVETAAQRNWDRYTKTGRLPPEWMLRNVHSDVSRTLPEAVKQNLFDKVELYDTNASRQLRPVLTAVKGQTPKIHNKQLYDDFLEKGKAPQLGPDDNANLITVQKAKAKAEGRATRVLKPEELAAVKAGKPIQEVLAASKTTKPKTLPAEKAQVVDRVGRMKVADIEADPARFQYKLNANSKTGEVGSLKGVQKWNEDLAGVVSVWKDPANGKTYVINGHNRLALAKRLNAEGDLPVLYIKAKTAEQARAIGAKQNIANGDGTAIDAAKFMRDAKLTATDMKAAGLNLKGTVANQGAALAALPDHVFKAAVEGRLPIDKAAAIGRSGLSKAQMADAYKVVQSRPSISPAALDEVLAQAKASATRSRKETNLFGTSTVQTSTMLERAELAAKVKGDLSRTIRTLDRASGKSDVLAAKGNKINVTQAQVKAADARARADVFDLFKNRPSSPIATALNNAAANIQDAVGRAGKAAATKQGRALVDAALDAEIKKMTSSSKGLLRSVADLQAKQQKIGSTPPELALAKAAPDVTQKNISTRLLNPDTAKPGTIGSLRPEQIKTDAKRFQYKAATDAKTGEVGSLEGIKRYDPELAGVLTVWKDPANGQTYVINGHNRLAAAQRLGADAVSVRYIKAATADEARAQGALANIAEGQGTAIDAAKFMRSQGLNGDQMLQRGVPLRKDVARDGAALANLPDELFTQVINEKISIDKGATIGRSGLDAQGMQKVAELIAKRPSLSLLTVNELVQREVELMKQGTTGNLFGTTEDAGYQLERAQLSRGVRDGLLGEKTLFRTLSTSGAAQTLASAGSEVNTGANAQAAAEAERLLAVYDQLKNVSGPVNQALNAGAARLQSATNASERLQARSDTQRNVVEALREELSKVPGAPPPPPPEAPGQVGLFG